MNHCTDPTYQLESDFWYFWSPTREGCKLREGRDYVRSVGHLRPIPGDPKKIPDYTRLRDAHGVIPMTAFFGRSEAVKPIPDVESDDDPGAHEYREFRKRLVSQGFKIVSTATDHETYYKQVLTKTPPGARSG